MNGFTFVVDVGDQELESVLHGGTLTRGRESADEQPRAGYARLSYLDTDGSTGRVPLNAAAYVTCQVNGATVPTARPVWSGWVSDRADRIIGQGSRARATERAVTAVGDLGLAPRRPARDGGYPAQLDGERIRAALRDAYARDWLLALRNWDELGASTPTWESYDPQLAASDVGDGAFDLAADTDATDPYQVIRKAATDAGAVLFELGDGTLLYQEATDRGTLISVDTPTVLPAPLAPGLEASVALADAATDVAVGYVGGSATAADLQTARALGRRIEWSLSTSLTDSTQAQQRADAILAYRRNPRPTLTLTYQLAILEPDVADELLQLELGDYVELPDLGTVDGDGTGFVEQLALTIDRNAPTLTVTVSSPAASLAVVSWLAMAGAWRDTDGTWLTVD